MKREWQGQRVIVIGAARQGLALARYLSHHGARVVLNDQRSADQLGDMQAALTDTPVEWALGGHPLELLDGADLVCVSGGVPLSNPLVVEALRRGMPVSNDTQIFMEGVPCRTVGITGSAGKTTTTTLVGRIAEAATMDDGRWTTDGGPYASAQGTRLTTDHSPRSAVYRRVWVGGNIGDPLLNHLDEMQAGDLAILEISSFQLEQMTHSPNVAAILNITPNHLDRHATMEAYAAAKARIIDFQSAQDTAVLGRDDPGAWKLHDKIHGRLLSFGFSDLPAGGDGAYVTHDRFFLRVDGRDIRVPVEDRIALRGEHNRLNVLAACTIAFSAGFTPDDMLRGVDGFRGVPHRLEFVRAWNGADWYNDSIATAPERTIAAIQAFEAPLVLLLGGRDKELPWEQLAALVHQRVDHVVLFGEAAGKIAAALGPQIDGRRPYSLQRCTDLQQAVQAAARAAQPGFTVLLAPGGTSYDEFKDFEERGEYFRKWVHGLS